MLFYTMHSTEYLELSTRDMGNGKFGGGSPLTLIAAKSAERSAEIAIKPLFLLAKLKWFCQLRHIFLI